MKKLLLATLLTTASFTAIAGETIRFATEASYPPFEMTNAKNEIVGFDIDLAKAICKEIKVTCSFKNQAFDSLIPSLKFRRVDALMAGMDITPERLQQVDFTDTYYQSSSVFLTKKGSFTDIAALKGKRVGVQNGSTPQKYVLEQQKAMKAVPYESYQSAFLDLKNGRLDAVFGDTTVVKDELTRSKELSVLGDEVTDNAYFGNGLAIAVRKGNAPLLKKINEGLVKVKADGTYQKIHDTWFK